MNLAFGNRLFGVFKFLCIVGLFLVLSGCTNETLNTFSKIEKEASKYGTVSAGAVRVIDYDDPNLESARKNLRTALVNIRKRLLKGINDFNSPSTPEIYERRFSEMMFDIGLNIGKSLSGVPPEDNKQTSEKKSKSSSKKEQTSEKKAESLSEVFHKIIETKMPQPNKMDIIARRMAELKFIESEIEDVNLNEIMPVDPNYRRVLISLDFTAWVRGEARAVLVYIDLYPFDMDVWCHKIVEELGDINEPNYIEWKNLAEEQCAFPSEFITSIEERPKIKGQENPIARCHSWLAIHNLLPRIVHIERFSKSEYLILGEEDYRGLEYRMGVTPPAGGLSATMGAKMRKETGRVGASIRPLNLAFVAGEQRAGWLFMPSRIEGGKMPPTERRLRMVVDIPKDLSILALHVHKLFLDANFDIPSDATFANQMANLNLAGWKLNKAEDWYAKYKAKEPLRKDLYYAAPKNWRLVKSRMRNLLYQGWSEELIVDVKKRKKK